MELIGKGSGLMGHSTPARRLVACTAGIAVALAGLWGATMLLPPTGPADEAEAIREITTLFAQIDSTLKPDEISDRDDQATVDQCPLEGQGLQSTLERDYHLNELFNREEWLDTLKTTFPPSDWYINTPTSIGNSEGLRIRLADRTLLAINITLVGEGAQQRLRLNADSRCYPEPQ